MFWPSNPLYFAPPNQSPFPAQSRDNFFGNTYQPSLAAHNSERYMGFSNYFQPHRRKNNWLTYNRNYPYIPHRKRRSHLDDVYYPNYDDTLEEENRYKTSRQYQWRSKPSNDKFPKPTRLFGIGYKHSESSQNKNKKCKKEFNKSNSGAIEEILESENTKNCNDNKSSDETVEIVPDESETNKTGNTQVVNNLNTIKEEKDCTITSDNSRDRDTKTQVIEIVSDETDYNVKRDFPNITNLSNLEENHEKSCVSLVKTLKEADWDTETVCYEEYITIDKLDTRRSFLNYVNPTDNHQVVDMEMSTPTPPKQLKSSKPTEQETSDNLYFQISPGKIRHQLNAVLEEDKEISNEKKRLKSRRSSSTSKIEVGFKTPRKTYSAESVNKKDHCISYNFDIKTNLLLLLKTHNLTKEENKKNIDQDTIHSECEEIRHYSLTDINHLVNATRTSRIEESVVPSTNVENSYEDGSIKGLQEQTKSDTKVQQEQNHERATQLNSISFDINDADINSNDRIEKINAEEAIVDTSNAVQSRVQKNISEGNKSVLIDERNNISDDISVNNKKDLMITLEEQLTTVLGTDSANRSNSVNISEDEINQKKIKLTCGVKSNGSHGNETNVDFDIWNTHSIFSNYINCDKSDINAKQRCGTESNLVVNRTPTDLETRKTVTMLPKLVVCDRSDNNVSTMPKNSKNDNSSHEVAKKSANNSKTNGQENDANTSNSFLTQSKVKKTPTNKESLKNSKFGRVLNKNIYAGNENKAKSNLKQPKLKSHVDKQTLEKNNFKNKPGSSKQASNEKCLLSRQVSSDKEHSEKIYYLFGTDSESEEDLVSVTKQNVKKTKQKPYSTRIGDVEVQSLKKLSKITSGSSKGTIQNKIVPENRNTPTKEGNNKIEQTIKTNTSSIEPVVNALNQASVSHITSTLKTTGKVRRKSVSASQIEPKKRKIEETKVEELTKNKFIKDVHTANPDVQNVKKIQSRYKRILSNDFLDEVKSQKIPRVENLKISQQTPHKAAVAMTIDNKKAVVSDNVANKNNNQSKKHQCNVEPRLNQSVAKHPMNPNLAESDASKTNVTTKLCIKVAKQSFQSIIFLHAASLICGHSPVSRKVISSVQINNCTNKAVVTESVKTSKDQEIVKQTHQPEQPKEEIVQSMSNMPVIDLTDDSPKVIECKSQGKPGLVETVSGENEEIVTLYRSDETINNSLDVQATSESRSVLLKKCFTKTNVDKNIPTYNEVPVQNVEVNTDSRGKLKVDYIKKKTSVEQCVPLENVKKANKDNFNLNLSGSQAVSNILSSLLQQQNSVNVVGNYNKTNTNQDSSNIKERMSNVSGNRTELEGSCSAAQQQKCVDAVQRYNTLNTDEDSSNLKHRMSVVSANQTAPEWISLAPQQQHSVNVTGNYNNTNTNHNGFNLSEKISNVSGNQTVLERISLAAQQQISYDAERNYNKTNTNKDSFNLNQRISNVSGNQTVTEKTNLASRQQNCIDAVRHNNKTNTNEDCFNSNPRMSVVSGKQTATERTSLAPQQQNRVNAIVNYNKISNSSTLQPQTRSLSEIKSRNQSVSSVNFTTEETLVPRLELNINNILETVITRQLNTNTKNGNTIRDPPRHVGGQRTAPLPQLTSTELAVFINILVGNIFYFNATKRAYRAYLCELQTALKGFSKNISEEIMLFDKYHNIRDLEIAKNLIRRLKSACDPVKIVGIQSIELLMENVVSSMQKIDKKFTITLVYIMTHTLMELMAVEYFSVPILYSLYGYVDLVTTNLMCKVRENAVASSVPQDPFSPQQRKLLQWQINQYVMISSNQTRLLNEIQNFNDSLASTNRELIKTLQNKSQNSSKTKTTNNPYPIVQTNINPNINTQNITRRNIYNAVDNTFLLNYSISNTQRINHLSVQQNHVPQNNAVESINEKVPAKQLVDSNRSSSVCNNNFRIHLPYVLPQITTPPVPTEPTSSMLNSPVLKVSGTEIPGTFTSEAPNVSLKGNDARNTPQSNISYTLTTNASSELKNVTKENSGTLSNITTKSCVSPIEEKPHTEHCFVTNKIEPPLRESDIETIDLTWIRDIDPRKLESEIEFVSVKKEEPCEGINVEDDFIPAPSPPDSGIGSPAIQLEYDEALFSNRPCICGKIAYYLCGCRTVMYCSMNCQLLDWEVHKDICMKYSSKNSNHQGQ